LHGDQGARSLLAAGKHTVEYLRLEDPGAALDIDAPEDYERARSLWQERESGADNSSY
jgi:CTP:molybdopterin cytidylyltransferase MocA